MTPEPSRRLHWYDNPLLATIAMIAITITLAVVLYLMVARLVGP